MRWMLLLAILILAGCEKKKEEFHTIPAPTNWPRPPTDK
jgi:hypothetical protein